MRYAALIPIFMTAACVVTAGDPEPVDPGICGAENLQYLVGRTEGALAAMTFEAGAVRVIRPGMAVTMDYSPTRLNILLDERGRIVEVYCG